MDDVQEADIHQGTLLHVSAVTMSPAHATHGDTALCCCCYSGQTCPDYANPVTGASAIDFNFLPVYASDTMGIMPHTVQLYNLDGDPAPTYGCVREGRRVW